MKFKIVHESRGRIRVQVIQNRMTLEQADLLEAYLCTWPAAQQVTVHERTCCAIVRYEGDRQELLTFLSRFSYTSTEIAKLAPTHTGRALNREYQEKLVMKIVSKALRSALLPAPLATAYTLYRSVPYLVKGIQCLWKRKLHVELLDALSIGISMARKDFSTAGSVMFLLSLGLHEITFFFDQPHLSALDLGHIQNIVDKPKQIFRGVLDFSQTVDSPLLSLPIFQCNLRHTDNTVHRSTDLMRHTSQEIRFRLGRKIVTLQIQPVLNNCADFFQTLALFFFLQNILVNVLEYNTSGILSVVCHMEYNIVSARSKRLNQWFFPYAFPRGQKLLHFLGLHKVLVLLLRTVDHTVPAILFLPGFPAVQQVIYHIFPVEMGDHNVCQMVFLLQLQRQNIQNHRSITISVKQVQSYRGKCHFLQTFQRSHLRKCHINRTGFFHR